jgi:hypothetical protein
MPRRAAPIGSDRERAYRVLGDLKRDGWIERYIATQFPSGRWGFRLTMHDGSDFLMLPREVHAFSEGIKLASRATHELQTAPPDTPEAA